MSGYSFWLRQLTLVHMPHKAEAILDDPDNFTPGRSRFFGLMYHWAAFKEIKGNHPRPYIQQKPTYLFYLCGVPSQSSAGVWSPREQSRATLIQDQATAGQPAQPGRDLRSSCLQGLMGNSSWWRSEWWNVRGPKSRRFPWCNSSPEARRRAAVKLPGPAGHSSCLEGKVQVQLGPTRHFFIFLMSHLSQISYKWSQLTETYRHNLS